MRLLHLFSLGLVCLLTSCGTRPAPEQQGHSEGEEVFLPGKGLLLSSELKQSLGVEMTDVVERTVGSTVTATAQVYRGADEMSSSDGAYRSGVAYASATIPADAAKGLKVGQPVTIHFKAAFVGPSEARIHRMDDALRKAMGTIEILLAISDPEKRLAVGFFLSAELKCHGEEPVIAVPQSTIFQATGGPSVYVQSSRHLLRTAVKAGASDGQWVEIRDGLLPGDTVVSRGADKLWLIELRATQRGGCSH